MTTDIILKEIQNSCESFLENNLKDIITTINSNRTVIPAPLKGYRINKVDLANVIGVYAFFVKSNRDIEHEEILKELWLTNLAEDRLHSPAVISKRFKKIMKDHWTCIYVGKSLKLLDRINQHIDQKTKYTTYGLKLSEHDRLHSIFDFAYSYYILHAETQENLDAKKCLNVTIESHLREQLQPLIGKQ